MTYYYFMKTEDWQQLKSLPRDRNTLNPTVYVVERSRSNIVIAWEQLYAENPDLTVDGRRIKTTYVGRDNDY